MNNFHVYEAIGRGKHSTVYKGRKKKTLEYYAIKSVDKSQRSKVLQEVRALNSLDHPNILKFFFCYETSAHLWLVLEYCVGGDLMTLLRQDSRLPEDSIHDLARDLVKALQFLHSKGIIYSDLKPSNILLDENGRMKLCDFGLARSIAEISKNSLSTLPQAKRGTPCYMAPELFQEGGVHSYASDFWALGCILYECYAGRPPFLGNEFTQLVKSILSDPMPPLLDNPSCSFLNLVKRLLVKDPSERIQWPELCGHSFWRSKFTPVTLHPQPDFSNMLQLYIKPHSSECNTDKSAQQRTPSKLHEREPTGVQKQDENCLTSAINNSVPTKTAQSGRKTCAKNIAKVDDKKRDTSNAAKVVNVLRLSRIAKQNLQRENDKENYRRPFPKNYENNVEVNIQNNDMELDFSENPEDDTLDESDNACVHDEKISIQSENDEKTEDDELNMNISEMKLENNVPIPNDVKGCEPDLLSDNKPATPPSVSPHRNAQCHKAGPCKTPDSIVTNSVNDLLEALWHQSDLLVKPVMPSRKCDKASETTPMLPFDASTPYDYAKLQPKHLEALNSRIIHTLSGTAQLSEKQNTIKYLELICMNTDAANILMNGPIMPLLVKMLRLSKTPSLRALLASLIGLVIRHSTSIKPDLAASGLINVLMDGLRDKQDKVRRFCMAAMGELLFYISTQNDHNDVDCLASPLKDNRSVSNWQVPSSVITLVSSILRKGEDDIAQLYALRTIENICSQGGDWTSRFTNQSMIGNLCYISKAMGKQESTRLTAGSCLVRLARFSPSCVTLIFDKFSFKDTASSLVKGSSREQQICLNLLSMALVGGQTVPNFSRQLNSLVEEKQLVPSLVSLIEQGTEVLKGKTLIFIALLCKNSRRWLPYFFCNSKFILTVDRLMKEKDSFIQHSMKAFVVLVATTVPGILETVRGDIQQMILGKRHGQISSLIGRSNLKCTVHLFSVVLHLLGSSTFKSRVATNQVLSLLAVIIKLIESPFQGRDEFQITLLQILESISEDSPLVLQDPIIFSSQLLPSLAILYRGNKDGDARFLCLKILFDVMVVFFNDGPIEVKEAVKEDLKSLSNNHFLHLYPAFIEDEDPIPMYAQKLLLMLIEFHYVKVSAILNLKTVSRCFDFLLGDLSSANVNSVKLCLALASDPEMEAMSLSQLKVVRKIGNLLEFVAAKEMEDLLKPTLSLCKAFILQSVGIHKGIMYSNEPALLLDTAMDMQIAIEQNRSVKDISDFSSNIGVFFELIGHMEQYVADLASECVVLLLKAAPRESTMVFLTNLSKLSSVFQSLRDRVSGLVLLRLLYSLTLSVRQYLSQAMILSISVSDVRRIETIASSFKTSGKTDVSNAAALLCLELQRLPRCV